MSDHTIIIWFIKTFLIQFCAFLPPLLNHFLLLGPYSFCPLLCPSLCEIFPWYLNFLEDSSSLPILCFPSIYLHCPFKKAFLYLLSILWTLHSVRYFFPFLPCLSFLLTSPQLSEILLRQPLCLLNFFFLGLVLVTASYTILWTSIHISSGSLSTRSNPLNLFVTFTVHS